MRVVVSSDDTFCAINFQMLVLSLLDKSEHMLDIIIFSILKNVFQHHQKNLHVFLKLGLMPYCFLSVHMTHKRMQSDGNPKS